MPESVTQARHAAIEVADAAGVDSDAVGLAVSEAVGNAVLHAFEAGGRGKVVLSADVAADVMTVSVADDGRGMRPDATSPGLGIGLSLIGSVASAFRVEAIASGGTRVTMRFSR